MSVVFPSQFPHSAEQLQRVDKKRDPTEPRFKVEGYVLLDRGVPVLAGPKDAVESMAIALNAYPPMHGCLASAVLPMLMGTPAIWLPGPGLSERGR